MFKKIIILLIAVSIISVMITGCSSRDKEKPEAPVRIGIVYSSGGLGDRSFNDSAHKGILRAEDELGIEYMYVESGNYEEDAESAIEDFASKDLNLVIAVGYEMSEPLVRVALEYPKIKFAIIDGELDFIPENVVNLVFGEHEGSFLVGALAALVSKSNTIGFLGGADVPLIHRFEGGFIEGAKYIKNIIKDVKEGKYDKIELKEFELEPEEISIADLVNMIVKEQSDKKYSSDLKIISKYAGSFNAPEKGKSIALEMIDKGADVIFHASGGTGIGLFEAAKAKGIYAIGVDANQNYEAPGYVIASMLKKIDVAVFNVIKDIVDEHFDGKTEKIFDLRHGGVAITNLTDIDEEEQLALDSKEITASELEAIRKLKKKVTLPHAEKIEILKTEFLGGNIIVSDWMSGKPQ